jgi:hypothetical protein
MHEKRRKNYPLSIALKWDVNNKVTQNESSCNEVIYDEFGV